MTKKSIPIIEQQNQVDLFCNQAGGITIESTDENGDRVIIAISSAYLDLFIEHFSILTSEIKDGI